MLVHINIQPSATHPNANDKTLVDLTWQAPGDPSTSDVTVWLGNAWRINLISLLVYTHTTFKFIAHYRFAITRIFTTVHAQLRGATLVSIVELSMQLHEGLHV